MNLESIFDKLKVDGSKFSVEELRKLKEELEYYLKKDYSKEEISLKIAYDVKEKTEELLYNEHEVISGISTLISIYDSSRIDVIGGKKIDENTFFDVASITKLYMGLLVLRLNFLGLLDLNTKINDITDKFDLPNYTINDIINMKGIIETKKRVDACSNEKEAFNALKNIHVVDNDKSIYNYTDIGIIALTYILEDLFGCSYEELLDKYVLKPLDLDASYKPKNNVVGNGYKDKLPHDPKARILNRPLGSAGIFTSNHDFLMLNQKIAENKELYDLCLNFCARKGKKPKGLFGSYTKDPLGLIKTYIPNEYSKDTFSFEGYTGSIVIFDLINKMCNGILVDAISYDTLLKHPSLINYLNDYQQALAHNSIKLLVIDKCYKEEKNFVKKIKI